MTGLLTGYSHLKGHIFKLELLNKPTHERCLDKDETAPHALSDYTALANFKLLTLGEFILWNEEIVIKLTTLFHLKCRTVSSLTKKTDLQQIGNDRCDWASMTHPLPVKWTNNNVFKHPVALIYHLFHTIYFHLQCYLLAVPIPLTTYFGHIWWSLGVCYFAKIAALYGMSKFSYLV
jgi:hypothetical protein